MADSLEQLYAFFYKPPTPLPAGLVGPGWTVYNPREEFARMGVGSRTRAWRFTDINKDYSVRVGLRRGAGAQPLTPLVLQFSPTYPAKMMVVPAKISDAVLVYAGKYRSKARIPALTYLHWANHVRLPSPRLSGCPSSTSPAQASITRCSQPLVGIKNARSPQDERLIDSIFQSHISPDTSYSPVVDGPLTASTSYSGGGVGGSIPGSGSATPPTVYGATPTNLIVDARPTTNAMANVAKGAGTENMENYKAARKAYLGIDNIHVMRESLNRLTEVVRDAEGLGSGGAAVTAQGAGLDRISLRRSNWLKHISATLDGALIIVKNVHVNSSHVLIHCSDGWDRTSQLAALAELCLDPFYRTFKGFAVLVEKDFLSFGHKFLDRCGHLYPDKLSAQSGKEYTEDDEPGGAERAAQAFLGAFQKQFQSSSHLKEISPVFHQFLDAVRQLVRQNPARFEFNEVFLRELHRQLYACQHGTFLFNTEKQRRTIAALGDDEISATRAAPWERTVSVWDYLALPEQRAAHTNELYDVALDDVKRADADMGVLFPRPRDVRYWSELFGRSDEEMNGRAAVGPDAQAVGVDVQALVGPADPDPAVKPSYGDLARSIKQVNSQLETGAPTALESGETYLVSRSASPLPVPNGALEPLSSGHAAARSPMRARNTGGLSASGSTGGGGGSGGGWGWSQLGSGAMSALNVIQGAAKEAKTFGTDAIAKLTAEGPGEETGEMWTRGGAGQGQGQGQGYDARRDARREDLWARPRIPSEANPWGREDDAQARPARAAEARAPTQETLQRKGGLPPAPAPAFDYLQSSANTWGSVPDTRQAAAPARSLPATQPPAPALHASLDTLSLGDTQQAARNKAPPVPPPAPPPSAPAPPPSIETKTWDPLGVL